MNEPTDNEVLAMPMADQRKAIKEIAAMMMLRLESDLMPPSTPENTPLISAWRTAKSNPGAIPRVVAALEKRYATDRHLGWLLMADDLDGGIPWE
jgi:hypothetical protein